MPCLLKAKHAIDPLAAKKLSRSTAETRLSKRMAKWRFANSQSGLHISNLTARDLDGVVPTKCTFSWPYQGDLNGYCGVIFDHLVPADDLNSENGYNVEMERALASVADAAPRAPRCRKISSLLRVRSLSSQYRAMYRRVS